MKEYYVSMLTALLLPHQFVAFPTCNDQRQVSPFRPNYDRVAQYGELGS